MPAVAAPKDVQPSGIARPVRCSTGMITSPPTQSPRLPLRRCGRGGEAVGPGRAYAGEAAVHARVAHARRTPAVRKRRLDAPPAHAALRPRPRPETSNVAPTATVRRAPTADPSAVMRRLLRRVVTKLR